MALRRRSLDYDDRRAAGHGRLVARPGGAPPLLRRRATHLHVLDSTDAGAVRGAARARSTRRGRSSWCRRSPAGRSRRSRTSRYFFEAAGRRRLALRRGHRPGLLAGGARARSTASARVFLNDPDIGGRYSALSYFGLVPAALAGVDLGAAARRRARPPRRRCQCLRLARRTPACGWAARSASWRWPGRDKLTFVVDDRRSRASGSGSSSSSPSRRASTARASSRSPTSRSASRSAYGDDRVFVHLRNADEPDEAHDDGDDRAGQGRPPGAHAAQPTAPPTSGGSSSSPSSPPRSPAGCWGSTRSTSPTCRRPRTTPSEVLDGAAPRSPRPTLADDASRCCDAGAAALRGDHGLRRRRRRSSTRRSPSCARAIRDRTTGDDHVRLRPALPALDRPAAQGRPAAGALPAARSHDADDDVDDPRRRPFTFEHAQARPGRRRPADPARARPAGRARRARRRPRRGMRTDQGASLDGPDRLRRPRPDGRQHGRPHQARLRPRGRRVRLRREGASRRPSKARRGRREVARATSSSKLEAPRTVWIMVPAGEPTQKTVDKLAKLLDTGDMIIDGGNSQVDRRQGARRGAARSRASTTSTSAPAAASGAWRSATA